ncbi:MULTISPECIES: copper chaperone PCu(A)C [unclassified Achromobacter]|uniref:copper chaperone PCu(A)C n=1 Tax=unclassified Achromobacter TaxID=2626865 RepID=UPI00069FD4FA|nr:MULTISPECIES: copper chaperone PCu(A)C [unclassified Achromobacter]KOF53210.1 hypothetical protein AD428_15100 [Achromobacter sp. DMS1]
MKFRTCAAIAAFGLCAAGSVWAGDYKVGQIEVDDLWVRASAPGQTNGAGYLDIDNDAKTPDRLLSVTSSAAERVELHTVQTENGVARMRQVDGGIAVPADGEVKLRPGGYHVMFIKLKAPFAEGGTVPATLKFERAGEVAVQFKVKPAGHMPGMDHGHGGMKH